MANSRAGIGGRILDRRSQKARGRRRYYSSAGQTRSGRIREEVGRGRFWRCLAGVSCTQHPAVQQLRSALLLLLASLRFSLRSPGARCAAAAWTLPKGGKLLPRLRVVGIGVAFLFFAPKPFGLGGKAKSLSKKAWSRVLLFGHPDSLPSRGTARGFLPVAPGVGLLTCPGLEDFCPLEPFTCRRCVKCCAAGRTLRTRLCCYCCRSLKAAE